eukprot:g30933.t1
MGGGYVSGDGILLEVAEMASDDLLDVDAGWDGSYHQFRGRVTGPETLTLIIFFTDAARPAELFQQLLCWLLEELQFRADELESEFPLQHIREEESYLCAVFQEVVIFLRLTTMNLEHPGKSLLNPLWLKYPSYNRVTTSGHGIPEEG